MLSFSFFPLSAHHQQKGRTIRAVQQRTGHAFSGSIRADNGGWPPVEEAWEGILIPRKVKMSDLQGPFQPWNSKISGRVKAALLGILSSMPWESLNFMNCFGGGVFLPFCLNPNFCLKTSNCGIPKTYSKLGNVSNQLSLAAVNFYLTNFLMAIWDPRTDHNFEPVGAKLQRPCLLNPLVWQISPSGHSAKSKDPSPPSAVKATACAKQYWWNPSC